MSYSVRDVDGLAVGEWTGSAGPVLAIHGISSTHKLWSWTASHLPDTRIVAPDLRGRGGSLAVGGPYSLRGHADDMLRVLDALDIERATVAGMSLGGFIAVTLAATAPDRVSDLLLVDGGLPMRLPIPDLKPDQLPAVFASRMERAQTPWPSVEEYAAFFRSTLGVLLDADDPILDDYLRYDLDGERARLDPNALLEDSADLFFGDTNAESLAALTTPTRLLYAEWSLGEGTAPAYNEDTIAEWSHLPSFRAALVPGTDHAAIVMTDRGAAVVAGELANTWIA